MKQILRENKMKSNYKKTRTDKENEQPMHLFEMPILSDSLLRRIQTNKNTSNSIAQQNLTLLPNVPTLPILSSRQSSNLDLKSATSMSLKSPLISNSLKLKTASNIALSNSINNLNNKISSAKYLSNKQAQHQLKKLNKTKFSAFNNFQLNELTSSSSSFNSSGSSENQFLLEDIFDNGFNFNTKERFNEKLNQNPQSSLLRKLRMNESETSNKTEIFVRPIPVKSKQADFKHKIQPININLAPLIKNFRLSSFDLQKFNTTNKNNEIFMQIPTNSIKFYIHFQ